MEATIDFVSVVAFYTNVKISTLRTMNRNLNF